MTRKFGGADRSGIGSGKLSRLGGEEQSILQSCRDHGGHYKKGIREEEGEDLILEVCELPC